MKKTIFAFFVTVLSFNMVQAGTSSYTLDNSAVELSLSQSTDVTLALAGELSSLDAVNAINISAEGEKSVGGFLLRSFFCGFIALHRSYMGTNGETMWWKYFCIPVVGGVANCGDFLSVLFGGQSALDKYKDNGKYIVWLK